jgi:hypothetical protein
MYAHIVSAATSVQVCVRCCAPIDSSTFKSLKFNAKFTRSAMKFSNMKTLGNFFASCAHSAFAFRARSSCAEAVRIMRVLDKLKQRFSNRNNTEGRGCQSLRDFDRDRARYSIILHSKLTMYCCKLMYTRDEQAAAIQSS